MIWLSDTTAVLNCAEEIGKHYRQYTPLANQFSLASPYQSSIPSAGPSVDPADQGYLQEAADEAHDNGIASTPAPTGRRKRKRRKVSEHDIGAEVRREEANKRHADHEQLLLDAYKLFSTWVESSKEHIAHLGPSNSESDLDPRRTAPVSQQSPCLIRDEARQPSPACRSEQPDAAAQAFDLLALSELRKVLKPKFQYHNSGKEVDLFETLLENTDEAERLATAFTTPVVIPARSRFLISDITRLQPLLAGASQCYR